jgi:hypothetical protein
MRMSTRNLKVSLFPLLALVTIVYGVVLWKAAQDSPPSPAPRVEGESKGLAPAVPPNPMVVYGTVKGNGQNIPDGTPITAWCSGVQYGQTESYTNEGESSYIIEVLGDDTETPGEKEGCAAGETVDFFVDGYPAKETVEWAWGGFIPQNLTYSFPTPTATATPTATPTASATPTPTATPVPSEGGKVYLPLIQSQ